ncbi:MAG: hypothetical protein ACYDHD_04685 [Vulcanimicrobiaceae bacterium]
MFLAKRLGKTARAESEEQLWKEFLDIISPPVPTEIPAIILPAAVTPLAEMLAASIVRAERAANRRVSETHRKRLIFAIRSALRRPRLTAMAESLQTMFFFDVHKNGIIIDERSADDSILVLIERAFKSLGWCPEGKPVRQGKTKS